MSEVLVDAEALNALCEEAANDMRFRHLVAEVRNSVKSAPRKTSRRSKASIQTDASTQAETP